MDKRRDRWANEQMDNPIPKVPHNSIGMGPKNYQPIGLKHSLSCKSHRKLSVSLRLRDGHQEDMVSNKEWRWFPHRAIQTKGVDPTEDSMMTSSNGNIFRVTGPLCGEFTGHRWIPLTKASDVELWCFLWSVPWINVWVNNCEAGDLRHHPAHYDVTVMSAEISFITTYTEKL